MSFIGGIISLPFAIIGGGISLVHDGIDLAVHTVADKRLQRKIAYQSRKHAASKSSRQYEPCERKAHLRPQNTPRDQPPSYDEALVEEPPTHRAALVEAPSSQDTARTGPLRSKRLHKLGRDDETEICELACTISASPYPFHIEI